MKDTKKILVVDKDTEMARAVRKATEIVGATATFAATRQEGIDKAQAEKPELILLGYIEPRGEAYKLNQALRKNPKTATIPQLVVDVSEEDHERKGWRRDEGMMMDADDYISRPVKATELAQHIEELLPTETEDLVKEIIETTRAVVGTGKR